jgi:hypothetical protein
MGMVIPGKLVYVFNYYRMNSMLVAEAYYPGC